MNRFNIVDIFAVSLTFLRQNCNISKQIEHSARARNFIPINKPSSLLLIVVGLGHQDESQKRRKNVSARKIRLN